MSGAVGAIEIQDDEPVPPKPSATLTEAELRLMEVLWQRGPSTVQQVLDDLPGEKVLAYNSVLTTIRILEKKGYVAHAKDGRAFVYAPVVERSEATRSEVRHLVQRLFQNSHELLVLNILKDSGLTEDELQRLKQYLRSGNSHEPRGCHSLRRQRNA